MKRISSYLSAHRKGKVAHPTSRPYKAAYVLSPALEERRRLRSQEHDALRIPSETPEFFGFRRGQPCCFLAFGKPLHPLALIQRNRPRRHTPQLSVI